MTLNLIKAKPRRYVYHVSYPCNRLSIYEEGIRPHPTLDNKYTLLFVNNHPLEFNLMEFWPLPIDWYDRTGNYGNVSDKVFKSQYDYWRIDTKKVDVEWYIDPYMKADFKYYCNESKPNCFLCTPTLIPISALDLMEFDLHGYNRFGQAYNYEHPELNYSSFNRMVRYRSMRNTLGFTKNLISG